MRALLVVLVCFLSACSTGSMKGSDAAESVDDFSDWMLSYYQDPEPARVPDKIKYSAESFESGDSRIVASYFYAETAKQEPKLVPVLCKVGAMSRSESFRDYLLDILWLVHSKKSKQCLAFAHAEWKLSDKEIQKVNRLYPAKPLSALKTPVRGALTVNVLWAVFAASGDPEPVDKIISFLGQADERDHFSMEAAGAARLSLETRAEKDLRVRSIIKRAETGSKGITRKVLETILHEVER